MRVFMLGWEFPPFIAGGLGTACYGLTRALDRMGQEILFVLPKPVDGGEQSHVKLLSPKSLRERSLSEEDSVGMHAAAQAERVLDGEAGGPEEARAGDEAVMEAPGAASGGEPQGGQAGEAGPSGTAGGWQKRAGFERTLFRHLPASFWSPYPLFGAAAGGQAAALAAGLSQESVEGLLRLAERGDTGAIEALRELGMLPAEGVGEDDEDYDFGSDHYGTDLLGDSRRYARMAVRLARRERFDVIHAHDWLTYPAGIAVRAATGRPLVVHVHATEFDRSGTNVNQTVYSIERAGMHAADHVVAVSQLTKSICVNRYGVPASKVDVVYNGVDRDRVQPQRGAKIESRDKIVLFLGRITMQKGPEYFIAAAKRVLEKMDNVKFVVAGSGDMAMRMIDQAAGLGIGHKVLFTGFLRGADVERVYRMADCYVMPSVSEPFGIVALEAIHHDTPVIISKQSGVSEVLTHALKVDFWDIDEMANKILAVLRHPVLSQTLREQGTFELRQLTWDGAAVKCVEVYQRLAPGAA